MSLLSDRCNLSPADVTQDTRYGNLQDPLTGFVEEVHHGATMLLAYWHYYKRCDLMNFDWNRIEYSPLRYLEPHQVALVRSTVEGIKKKRRCLPFPLSLCGLRFERKRKQS
jgi:hypothetical protein